MAIGRLCEIAEIERLTEDIYSFRLDAGPMAREAVPGQFAHIKCGGRQLLRRPISICETEGDLLRIVFQVRGTGTEWLSGRRTGERLDVLGPLGTGFRIPAEGRILLAGGGIGSAPLLFAGKNAPGRAEAVLGFRDSAGVILTEDFARAGIPVRAATEDGSFGTAGRVDLPARERLAAGDCSAVLACGPTPMLRAVARAAARAKVPCQVSLEERMGCGIGACLTCSCKVNGHYLRVCKDGPVFDAGEVDWDA